MRNQFEFKLLVDCQEHICELGKLQFEEISRYWVPDASIERVQQRLVEHTNRDALPLTVVALENDKPIGMASLRDNDGIRSDLTPWLGSLVINPYYRRNGVGRKMCEAIKQQALRLGFNKLYLLAFDPSIPKWYESLGWKCIGVDRLFNHPVTVMESAL